MSASGIPKEEAELIERFKAFVEQEARLQQAKFHAFSAERAQQVQAEFWAKMKAALCVNKFSENLEVLDYVAAAIINGSPDPEQAFCRPVMILPRPERQRFGLCADPYIEQVQLEISSLSPESTPVGSMTVPAFDAKETKTVGWAAYKLVDGSPSALAPRVKVPLQEEGYFLNDGDEEEEKGE
ncbi:hypothetical protein PRIC2_000985 [Phytophthora ramorum]